MLLSLCSVKQMFGVDIISHVVSGNFHGNTVPIDVTKIWNEIYNIMQIQAW